MQNISPKHKAQPDYRTQMHNNQMRNNDFMGINNPN